MIHSRIAIPCCLSSWKHMGHSLPFPHHQINIQIITHTHTLLTAFLKINYKSAAKRKWQNLFRTSRNDWGINHHAKFFAQRFFSLKKKKRKCKSRVIHHNVRRTWPTIAGFEDGRRLWAREHGQPLVAGKDKETDSPLGLPGGIQACQHPDFGTVRPVSNFWPPEL